MKKIYDDIYMICKNEDFKKMMPMKESICSVALKLSKKKDKNKALKSTKKK